MREVCSTLIFAGLIALAAGCGGKDEKPTCDKIAETCHPLDTGPGEIHDCHEFTEEEGTTEADCVAKEKDCLAKCVAPK